MKKQARCYTIGLQDTYRATNLGGYIIDIGEVLFDRYEILKPLGAGAFGTVYLVRHVKLGSLLAMKCFCGNSDNQNSAIREADILKNLKHPSIPTIFDIEESNGITYIIEEYAEGISLTELISHKKLHINQVVDIAVRLCDVLEYLHSMHIFHMDIKPENIIYNDGKIKLLDYGSSIREDENRRTYTGTKGYAAPEIYDMGQANNQSDVYSLGVVILYMATGRKDKEAIRICNKGLKKIVRICLSHTGAERPATIKELRSRLIALSHKSIVENVSLNIHIGGTCRHCGTTHCARAIGHIMRRRGFRTIVCEKNDSGDFFELFKEKDFIFDRGIFSLKGEELIPEYNGCVDTKFLENFDRIISDFGIVTEDNLEEFLKGDLIYLVSGAEAYEIKMTQELLGRLNKKACGRVKICILVNLTDVKRYKEIIRRFGLSFPVRVPFETDFTKSKKDWLA